MHKTNSQENDITIWTNDSTQTKTIASIKDSTQIKQLPELRTPHVVSFEYA